MIFISPIFSVEVPPYIQRALNLDRNNTQEALRTLKPLSAKDQLVEVFPHVEIPISDVFPEMNLDDLTPQTKEMLFAKGPDGHLFLRLFLKFYSEEDQKKLLDRYKPAKSEFYGTKVLSKKTYWIFNPQNKDSMLAKNTEHDPSVVRNYLLDSGLKSQGGLLEIPPELITQHSASTDVSLSFVDETLNYFVKGFNVGQTIRASDVFKNLHENEEYLPLHAIQSKFVESLARARGLSSVEEWLSKEYAPFLGKAMAQLNRILAVYGGLHAQNLAVIVDKKTGRIKKLLIKDFRDLLVDAKSVFHKKAIPNWESLHKDAYLTGLQGVMSWKESDKVYTTPTASALMARYVLKETIGWAPVDSSKATLLQEDFLRAYTKEFSQIEKLDVDYDQEKMKYHLSQNAFDRQYPHLAYLDFLHEEAYKKNIPVFKDHEISSHIPSWAFSSWYHAKNGFPFDGAYTDLLNWRSSNYGGSDTLLKSLEIKTVLKDEGLWFVRWNTKTKSWVPVGFIKKNPELKPNSSDEAAHVNIPHWILKKAKPIRRCLLWLKAKSFLFTK